MYPPEDGDKKPYLPSHPSIHCDWGDGLIDPNMEEFYFSNFTDRYENSTQNRSINLDHAFGGHGIYAVNCTLWNKISEQQFAFNVRNLELSGLETISSNIFCLA